MFSNGTIIIDFKKEMFLPWYIIARFDKEVNENWKFEFAGE